MAFAESSNFTINHSTFIDNSTITKNKSNKTKKLNGHGFQILLNASSTDAAFDSQARHPPPLCHPRTRTGLLDHIFRWVDAGEEKILFLDGPAGAGKTAIGQTVAAICAEKKTLLPKAKKMKKAIESDPSILDKSPGVQARKLILKVYQPSLFRWNLFTKQKRRLLIIDGLDECNGDGDQRQIVELLGRLVNNKHFTVRCLIASRPEPHILSAIRLLPTEVARVTLSERSWDATGDVRIYLRSRFDEIAPRVPSSIPRPWPSDAIIKMLVQKAGGVFIYASTVVKYIGDQDSLPTTQLEHVLKLSPGTAPFAELDQLYQQILLACPLQHRPTLLHIFGLIFLRNPAFEEAYDISLIEALLELSPGEATTVLRRMHSILTITTTGSKSIVSFLHASFGDFIFNEERSGRFFIDRQRESLFLATKCINYLDNHTRKGIDCTYVGDMHIIYAWNSWAYHGVEAGSSSFVDFVAELSRCDKDLWAEVVFPEGYHHFCMDGLEAGISWLRNCSAETPADVLISDLTSMGQRLEEIHCESVLANLETSLTVLRVFGDPGINFFEHLDENYVVALERHGNTLEVLYFKCHTKVYDCGKLGMELSADSLRRFSQGGPSRHSTIAMQCIRTLKNTRALPMIGLEYAAKYWAKHLSLSDITGDILEELQQMELKRTIPDRQVTAADVSLVIQWLEKVPYPQREQLLFLWKNHLNLLSLESKSGLGLRNARLKETSKVGRWKSVHGTKLYRY